MTQRLMFISDCARHFGVPVYALRNLYARGALRASARIKDYNIIFEEDLPEIRARLLEYGYLPADAETQPQPETVPSA